jgi:integrase
MGTIRRRGSAWQVQIRRIGHNPLSRSFSQRDEAQRWMRATEASLDLIGPSDQEPKDAPPTIGELLERYEREITPGKRSNDREVDKLRVIRRHAIGTISAPDLESHAVATYRDTRLRVVKPATVRRELAILRHCLEIAIHEWGLPLASNPARRIRLANSDVSRSRRLSPEEFTRFWSAIGEARSWYLKPIFTLAFETAMRRGEILAINRRDNNSKLRLLTIPKTKNGHPRIIPLSSEAQNTLLSVSGCGKLFEVPVPSLRQSWVRLLRRAQINDFRFHDLRHEAISRYFEMGLSIPEVALISGHRDTRMLTRYTHLKPEVVAMKLP